MCTLTRWGGKKDSGRGACYGSEEGASRGAVCGVGRAGGGSAVLHGLPHAVADGVKELLDAVGARAGGDVGHAVCLGPRLGGGVVDGDRGLVVALVADQEVCDAAVAAVALCLGNPLLADVQCFLCSPGKRENTVERENKRRVGWKV